jgi:hypothetical protein
MANTFVAQTKQPSEIIDYDFNFSDLLEAEETVTDITVSITGATLDDTTEVLESATVKCWVSGGTHKTTAHLTCLMETDLGRIYEADLEIPIRAL